MPQVTFKIEKQAPTINVADGNSENLELFHGIGNTLGFNITGGSDFSMPITIFHVKEGSRAENAGLKLGDSIVNINNIDTSNMTLQEANNVLEQAAQQDVKLGVIKFDEVDEANPEKKPQVHSVVLEGKRKAQRNKLPYEDELRPPSAAYIEKPERKSWHPIMWPTPEFAQPVNFQKELPHKRIIRNLRRLLTDIADKPAEREKHLEQLLLSLPRGSADPLAVIRPKPESSNEEEEFPEGDEDKLETGQAAAVAE